MWLVIEITVLDDETQQKTVTPTVKILLDHAEQVGYLADLSFTQVEGKAIPGDILYQDLPERFLEG